jgi:peptidoglycan/LPS O-acetylase OafA/YrhL
MSATLKYRPDIDGLRAVAVLGVIIYHAFPKLLPGGFSGVDIFFVISGYLISGILYKGHREGHFSFKEFYARRIRRLFPSLITVLLLSLAYGWLVLLPDEYEKLGKHVAAGTLFIQNMVFWQESGYFDTVANLKPLLHLWSLAVEEQFYIFFPPLLLLIWKRKWPIAIIMGVLLAGSFIGNVVMSYQNGASDFFLTPYRAWEFLGGSLLAWWHYDRGHEEEIPKYREVMSWVGLILLGTGLGLLNKQNPYPGWRALLPVGGTCLLIEGGRGALVNRSILSNPALVWIGLISYPLYLFHWPALSFVHIVKGANPGPGFVWMALGVTLALTLFSYYLVEKKIRYYKSPRVLSLLVLIYLSLGCVGWGIYRGWIPAMSVSGDVQKCVTATRDHDSLAGLECLGDAKLFSFNHAGGEGPQTLYIGDSNAQQYAPRILRLLTKEHAKSERGALFLTSVGVPPIPRVTNPSKPRCAALMPKIDEVLKSDPRIDRVVIAARWHAYFLDDSKYLHRGEAMTGPNGRKSAMEDLAREIKDLKLSGKKVTLVLSVPSGDLLDPKSFFARDFTGVRSCSAGRLTVNEFLEGRGDLLSEIAAVARRNGAEVIDPMDYLCVDGMCIAEDTDGPIRYDATHLRPGYVRDKLRCLDFTVAP